MRFGDFLVNMLILGDERGGGGLPFGDHELQTQMTCRTTNRAWFHGTKKPSVTENVVKSQTLIAVSRSNFNRDPFLDLQPINERLELLGLVTHFSATPLCRFHKTRS